MNWFCGLLLGFIVGIVITGSSLTENRIMISRKDFGSRIFIVDGTLYRIESATAVVSP